MSNTASEATQLSWTLTICTFNRLHFLVETLAFAVVQTRPPAEIIIVDASDAWQEHRAAVQEQFAEHWKSINLVYAEAEVRSLTFQRNQAMRLATSDIVFSLDDDIYLFKDAADRVMRVYDADTKNELAMVAGQFTLEGPDGDLPLEANTSLPEVTSLKGRLRQWLDAQLTLDGHFVPYGPPVDNSPLPAHIADAGASAGRLINGGRTTARRKWAVETGWSELLRYYATHEDSDFSYRMSRRGRLVHVMRAGFFHADGNESKASRYRVNTIRVRNLMALHAIHSDNKLRSALRLTGSFGKFAVLYAIIDPVQKRFSFPTLRAYLFGLAQIPVFLFWPFADFSAWYTKLQERMYGTRYKS
ncbi:MAG: glycosyltransferase [Marinovum sp.]|nr:glycosyltransferase [Marinovum sp.]